MVTDQSQAVVWKTEQTPFGEVTQTTGTLAQPLRFPGQYADPETGYSYNYFRDYDPSVGRYVQSDPIGLRGGLNTYGYVYQNPLGYIDPTGENGLLIGGGGALILACRLNPRACAVGGGAILCSLVPSLCTPPSPTNLDPGSCPTDGGMYNESGDGTSQGPDNPPNIPEDPTQAPGEGWEWRGRGMPGSRQGAWHNPETGESLHDDRTHPPGRDPHVTYTDGNGNRWDNFLNGNGWIPQ
ncbi:MAG: hypothetical protein IPM37_09045 [Hahellaceae bacterium]|nr:hypothetical protein [Hahellaceae bacterium]